MEAVSSLQSDHSQPQSNVSGAPSFAPPRLRDGESYHVFISYSSADYQWTHSIINQLESCGLHTCYHERDFTPGRTVLENMSQCIQESQKVLLVLSPEFVRSRWCLLEANMSLFRDCLERKPIVPVLLQPGVQIPLHLCHLTYLEANDPDLLSKLLKVLCTPNKLLQSSTVMPFQPPSIYNGKALQPLTAANEERLHSWDCGQFSDMEVPDQLRLIIENKEKYREAVTIINSVSQTKVWLRPVWLRALGYFIGVLMLLMFLAVFAFFTGMLSSEIANSKSIPVDLLIIAVLSIFTVPLGWIIHLCLWKWDDGKHIVREMQRALGQANSFLYEEKLLMGCLSNSKIYLVYVSLEGCKDEFTQTFSEQDKAEDMFHRALSFFSSGYACCLSKKHFPFPQPCSAGHLEGGVCFCQYVSQQLSRGEWI